MKNELFNKRAWVIVLIIIVFIGLFIQYPYMNEFPSFIHAWSQSDRYSIDYDYVIIESEIYEEKKKENQDFLSTLTFLADNKKLMVFVKN